jgi:predicted aspartyl protease
MTSRIRIAEYSQIIVRVMINGSGPYDFSLDTGSSSTLVEPKLAAELALPAIGQRRIVGVQQTSIESSVHVNSISVGGATVANYDLVTSDRVKNLPVKVRGVLGEDFLQNFDVLIDYKHQTIQFESGLGPLSQTLSGEHLPLQLSGTMEGRMTPRRLIISAHIKELGDDPISVALDSGTNYLVLFQKSLGPNSIQLQTSVGQTTARQIKFLYLGDQKLYDITAMALDKHGDMDADGLVPTSLFQSIFISHQGKFVILNPSLPKKVKPATNAPGVQLAGR